MDQEKYFCLNIFILIFVFCRINQNINLSQYNYLLLIPLRKVSFFNQVFIIQVTYTDDTEYIIYRRYSDFFDFHVSRASILCLSLFCQMGFLDIETGKSETDT